MIVVEGPDGAGKSTLIRELVDEFDLPVADRVVSKDAEAMVDLKHWTEQNVSRGYQGVIYDRHRLISEPIYGSILRHSFEPGFNDLNWLYLMNYQFYNKCEPLIIYCLPSYDTVRANVKNDADNRVVREHIRKIYSLYAAKAATDAAFSRALLYNYKEPLFKDAIFRGIAQSLKEHGYV